MNFPTRLAVVVAVFLISLIGWSAGEVIGIGIGLMIGLLLLVVQWHRQPGWSWIALYARRNRLMDLPETLTLTNDRAGGGVRYEGDVAVVAVQLLGRRHQPTVFAGSTATQTANTVDICKLVPAMRQSLGLTIESISIISAGSRRRSVGDYPRVYDTLIGTPPYAGQRETWMVIRIPGVPNGDALQRRSTVGAAAVAAAQRIAAMLRCSGIRAKVASATDIVDLESRLGCSGLHPPNRRWRSVRVDSGWQTSYSYRPSDISTEALALVWTLRADGVIQNVTLFPDGSASAIATVRTAQPPTASPSVALQSLPGEQAQAVAASLCCPRPRIRGLRRGQLPQSVTIPIGSSGVLLGRTASGDRLLLPLADPGEHSRVHIAADDSIAKRVVIRAAGMGEGITVHTTNLRNWNSLRMPQLAVIEHPRPAPGTTVSVVDGTVAPAPRPNTVISIGPPGVAAPAGVDVIIAQSGPATVEITAAGERYDVAMDFFRVENRYVAEESVIPDSESEMAD